MHSAEKPKERRDESVHKYFERVDGIIVGWALMNECTDKRTNRDARL